MKKTVSDTKFSNTFTIALYKDGDLWVAHNLEFDVVGVDTSKDKAISEMRILTSSHLRFCIDHGMLSEMARPAPERFWKMVAEKKVERFKAKLNARHISIEHVDELVNNTETFEITNPSNRAEKRQTPKIA